MMINERNVLKILSSDKISNYVKDIIIKMYKIEIRHNIDNLNHREVLDYINNDNLPIKVKKMFDDAIDYYSEMDVTILLEEYFRNYYQEDDIYKESYPRKIREGIVKKKYGKSPLELLKDKELSLDEKKLMIDIIGELHYYSKILKSVHISDEVKDYVIYEKLTCLDHVFYILAFDSIGLDIKKKIIDKYLNYENYLDFMALGDNRISVSLKEKIYNDNKEMATRVINNINKDNIVEVLIHHECPSFMKELITTREDDIVKMMGRVPLYKYGLLLERIDNQELARKIIKKNRLRVELVIMDTTPITFLDIVNNPGIPNDIREDIIKKKWLTFGVFIKNAPVEYITSHLLTNASVLSIDVKKKIINERQDDLMAYFRKIDTISLFNRLVGFDYIKELIDLAIDTAIDASNVMGILSLCDANLSIKILKRKKNIIYPILNGYDTDYLLNSKMIDKNNDIVKNRIVLVYKDIYDERINVLNDKEICKYLDNDDVVGLIKILILDKMGINDDDIFNFLDLLDNYTSEFLLSNYSKLKNFFMDIGLDFKTFIQYGGGSERYYDWAYRLVRIVDTEKDNFLRVVKYLEDNNYMDEYDSEALVYRVINFIKMIEIFDDNRELLIGIAKEGRRLTSKEVNDLNFILRVPGKKDIVSLDMVDEYRDNLYKEYREVILKSNDINELKRIYLNILVEGNYESLRKIGGTGTLRNLKISNSESDIIDRLSNQLIKYSEIIEYGMDTDDIEEIRRILKYYFCDHFEELGKVQKAFLGFDEKVRYLFEMDARINLSSISDMHAFTRSKALEDVYGGVVYDLRDTNYILYAHVLSNSEDVDSLIMGESNGKRNFISTSAISYLGEKYYYGNSENILAIAAIPEGSFICSSLGNMGTNRKIKDNSFEVTGIENTQRGILETSVPGRSNSEILLYREGVQVVGIILPGGRSANDNEMKLHKEKKLPFIITQNIGEVIENPKEIFKGNKISNVKMDRVDDIECIQKLYDKINGTVRVNKISDIYTGREVAIFTDIHALYEPTLAVLEDIRRKGIHEIYSLGDNIGVGPNPLEVLDLFKEYGVISIAGNSEYYSTLGSKPFIYFDDERRDNLEWTNDEIGITGINDLKMYKASEEILVGNKKIALCHFINDVRWDYRSHSTWSYQSGFTPEVNAVQFLYTNSDDAKRDILDEINNHGYSEEELRGYVSAYQEPLFQGKNILEYDAVIQGHVHFEYQDSLEDTGIYTLRGLAIGYKNSKESDKACYYILKEKKDGNFDISKRNVQFNKRSMIANVKSSKIPHKKRIMEYIR